jgi:hypothetical protein
MAKDLQLKERVFSLYYVITQLVWGPSLRSG